MVDYLCKIIFVKEIIISKVFLRCLPDSAGLTKRIIGMSRDLEGLKVKSDIGGFGHNAPNSSIK